MSPDASDGAGGGRAEEVRRFLDEALRSHVIDEAIHLRLLAALEHREAARGASGQPLPIPARPDASTAAPALTSAPLAPAQPAPASPTTGPSVAVTPTWWKEPEPPPEPAAWAAWIGRVRELISSDLALHGLAYLGVLMVFVGVFGFVVFAFGELDPTTRPMAEAAVPAACFLACWFLRRQRAPHVAGALELLGGLTLPLVAYASFVDDGPVPPDLSGDALILALAVTSLAIGVAYAAWSVHRPASVLRYLVAPMAWMVVWALGLWFADGEIAGVRIREPNLWQMTAFTVAVVLSLVLSSAFPERRFASETRTSAIVGLALGYALVLATGFANGWQTAPVAITAAATLVGIDLLAAGFGARGAAGARIAQSLVVAFSAAALAPDLDPAWTGVAVVLAAVALLERWARGRVGRPEQVLALAELGIGLAMAAQEPWAMVVAFGVASAWAHVRRVLGFAPLGVPARARGAPASAADLAALLLPVGVAVGLWQALGPEQGLLATALVLVLATLAYRIVGTDDIATGWLVASAAAVGAAAAWPWYEQGPSSTLLVATIVAAGVLLAASPKGTPRVWLGAAGLAWVALLGMDLAELDVPTQAAIGAAVGLGAVLVAAIVLKPGAVAAHAEAVGLLVGAGALAAVVDVPGDARLACLGAWTLGWLVVTAAGEVREHPESGLADGLRTVGPVMALVLLAVLAADTARSAGLLEDDPSALGAVLPPLALLEALTCRALATRRPLAPIVAWGAFALTVLAIGLGASERWTLIVAVAGLIGVVLMIPPSLRAAPMTWSAWAASGALAVLLAERAGVPAERLYAVGFAWSAVVLLGALALDVRLGGARSPDANPLVPRVRTAWLLPPAVLGTVGLAVSLGLSGTEPASVYGWWMLGGAAVVFAAAALVGVPWISGVGWALAAFGAGSLAQDLVLEEPWVAVAGAAAMFGAAWALSRARLAPWSFPPFVVAHALVLFGLGRAVRIEELAPTFLVAAGVGFVVAAAIRRWEWAAASAVLAAVGAWDVGPAALAAVLGVESVAAGVAASHLQDEPRRVLQFVSAGLAAGSWVQAAEAAGWTPEQTRWATALASGVVLLAAGAAIRLRALGADWLLPAGALAAAGVLSVEKWTSDELGVNIGEPPTRIALAAAFAMATVALAISAAPAGQPRLRQYSAVTAALALLELLAGLEVPGVRSVAVLVGASVLTMVAALLLWRAGAWRTWAPAIGVFSSLAAIASLAISLGIQDERAPLVAALLVCGVESAAAGLVLRRVEPLILAPILLATAWIAFATELFEGNPQWFTIPIGLTALAVVEVLRWDHRRRGEDVRRPELIALEIAGIAFLIGASPIRVIQGSTWAGLSGLVLGLLVAAWGALTRVRRRLWIGVGAAVGCLLLMVLVPLTQRLPGVASAAPWVLLGAIGILVVIAATALERGRTRLRAALHHVGELLDGWE